jgi:hypothetical protein
MVAHHLITGGLINKLSNNSSLSLICALLLLVVTTGCSDLKTYPNTADKNLLVRTKMQSGSLFTDVEVMLHIYSLRDGCTTNYLGTVKLEKDRTQVGMMIGQPIYLKFIFNTSGMLSSSTATVPYITILTPRPGVQYSADVSYVDSIYNVIIREVDPRGTPGREIERNMGKCR